MIANKKTCGLFSIILSFLLFTACQRSASTNDAGTDGKKPVNSYAFGETVGFGQQGNSDLFKGGGWGPTEGYFAWTNGFSAILAFSVPETKKTLELRMHLGAYTNSTIRYQPVEVRVNDERVADWQVAADDADYVAVVPPDIANHDQLIVELRIPNATSPLVVGEGDDPRLLGVRCFELCIYESR
jgi:hypothetical protein